MGANGVRVDSALAKKGQGTLITLFEYITNAGAVMKLAIRAKTLADITMGDLSRPRAFDSSP
jgi:hypothetical protein